MTKRETNRSDDGPPPEDRTAAVTLRGGALVCAESFGGGDAQAGAQFLLDLLGAAWWALTRDDDDIPEPNKNAPTADEICEEGCFGDDDHNGFDSMFAWGFGITAHIKAKELTEAAAELIGGAYRESARAHPAPDVVTTNAVAVISAAVLNRSGEFCDVLASRIGRVITETFRDFYKASLSTIDKKFAELQGATYTMERRADVSKRIDTMFDREFPLPPLVKFSGMIGGASAESKLPEPTEEQRAAYPPLVKKLNPLWRAILVHRREYPDTWSSDILQLAPVRELSDSERSALQTLVTEIRAGRNTLNASGARVEPAACAREHARIITGISPRNDKKLVELTK